MNKFCVGQKVIDCYNDRKLLTIVKTFENGQIELDNGVITYTDRVQTQEHFLDNTSFFYHHSRYGKGLEMAKAGFDDLQFVLSERDSLEEWEIEFNAPRPKFHAFLDNKQKEAESTIEQGLALYRTAEYNLAQWDRLTLDYHFPFLNPENVINY